MAMQINPKIHIFVNNFGSIIIDGFTPNSYQLYCKQKTIVCRYSHCYVAFSPLYQCLRYESTVALYTIKGKTAHNI